jgi:cytochrome c oxidase subunit 3
VNAHAETILQPQFQTREQQSRAATFGMWVFLATELLFFGPLFFGYVYGRMHFPEAFPAASRHTSVALGTLNTAVLLTSSLTMALAVRMRGLQANRAALWLLWATALLGVVFIVIKGAEYRKEWTEHLFPASGFEFPAPYREGAQYFFFLYFVMTALHALHLTIGIAIVCVFAVALARRRDLFSNAERIETAGLYWHFVDTVWIFLYPILYLVGRSAGG